MHLRLAIPLSIAAGVALALVGCDSDETTGAAGGNTPTGGNGGSATGGSGGGGGGDSAGCTEPTEVPCSDQVIQQMVLKTDAAPGEISSEADGAGFISHIDGTAGGFNPPEPHSFVYGRFTATGLEKVAIGDEDSLDSMEWDIAFRRYVVRVNSGNSGPSCVLGARVPTPGAYDDMSSLPDGLNFRTDEYFSGSCELIPDGTGLPGSPATALSSYWSYPGCVSMTGNIFVIQLADGQHVKFMVTHYYDHTTGNQLKCDTENTVDMPSGSATFRVRWAYIQ